MSNLVVEYAKSLKNDLHDLQFLTFEPEKHSPDSETFKHLEVRVEVLIDMLEAALMARDNYVAWASLWRNAFEREDIVIGCASGTFSVLQKATVNGESVYKYLGGGTSLGDAVKKAFGLK